MSTCGSRTNRVTASWSCRSTRPTISRSVPTRSSLCFRTPTRFANVHSRSQAAAVLVDEGALLAGFRRRLFAMQSAGEKRALAMGRPGPNPEGAPDEHDGEAELLLGVDEGAHLRRVPSSSFAKYTLA